MRPRTKVLFVCTGNSIRSPMAEGLLKKALAEHGIGNVEVSSAGTMAPVGMPPTDYTRLIMAERGVSLESHRSRRLTLEQVEDANLILVMEPAHLRFIENLSYLGRGKTFLLKGFPGGEPGEIADPIGRDLEEYRECADQIETQIERLLPEIERSLDKVQGNR